VDPVLMTGAIAASILSVVAVGRIAWRAFERAVRSILREEIQRVHRDMDDIETRFERLESALEALQKAVTELRQMMFDHVSAKG
jgi:F0F1-type ATP synthase membrane subunit b/b'